MGSRAPDILKIHLNEGWNRLLVKAICDKALRQFYAKYSPDPKETLWHFAAYIRPAGSGPFSYETKNVTWMTKLTGHSASQPIVVGDKLFVGSGNSDLFCLDKKSGKILWMHTGTYWDAMTAEERAAAKDKAAPLLVELEKSNSELVPLLNENISPQGLDSSRKTVVDKKLGDRTKLLKSVHDALSTGQKGKLYLNEFSAGDATPTSDGKQVYWFVQGHGGYLASAFDLNGKQIWSSFDDQKDLSEHGPHSSPLLCEGKLIVKMKEWWIAYDTATGKELWRTPGFPNTSIDALNLVQFNGKQALQTTKNLVSLDGAILAECGYGIGGTYVPVVEDGVLYNPSTSGNGSSHSFQAFAIPKLHSTKTELIWELNAETLYGQAGNRGSSFYISSPLYADGLVYQVDAYGALTVINTKERKMAYQRWMDGYGFNYERAS